MSLSNVRQFRTVARTPRDPSNQSTVSVVRRRGPTKPAQAP